MVKTLSNMIELGTTAPNFTLLDVVSDKQINLKNHKGDIATVIMFICNHCPFVKHVNEQLTQLASYYMAKGIQFIAINSNDVNNYPDDSPVNMIKAAKQQNYPFVYLFDETQEVAQAYKAACTPDFYVFDKALSLVYRGQLDDSRPGNDIPCDGSSIRQTLDHLLNDESVQQDQKPSIGCNIKWKS